MKKHAKALRLHRETLRSLDATESGQAVAGAVNTASCIPTCTPTCPTTCGPTCPYFTCFDAPPVVLF